MGDIITISDSSKINAIIYDNPIDQIIVNECTVINTNLPTYQETKYKADNLLNSNNNTYPTTYAVSYALLSKSNLNTTITGGTNIGSGINIFNGISNNKLNFKSLNSSNGILINNFNDNIQITTSTGSTGFMVFNTFDTYSGNTNVLINSKLNSILFDTYSGITAPNQFANKIHTHPYSGLTGLPTLFIGDNYIASGGTNTFVATGALSTLDYDSTIDRLVIISSGAAGDRSYVTQFNNSGNPMDQIFLTNDLQIDQGNSALSETTPHPTPLNIIQTVGVLNGLYYFAGVGTTQATNILHIVPCGADWQYASTTSQRLITPAFSTPNCNNFVRAYAIQDELLGDAFLGKNPDPYRIYYRTANINVDAVTGWIQLTDGNSLASIGAATQIQFMLDFKCISDFCIPCRIFAVGVVYSDLNTDSHYQPSANYSNITTGTFAWRFSTAWGSTVPPLRIRLYDAILGSLIIDDNTTTPTSGTWQKTTNAGTIPFGAYDSLDQTNLTTYISYTPTSLSSGITVKALLTTL